MLLDFLTPFFDKKNRKPRLRASDLEILRSHSGEGSTDKRGTGKGKGKGKETSARLSADGKDEFVKDQGTTTKNDTYGEQSKTVSADEVTKSLVFPDVPQTPTFSSMKDDVIDDDDFPLGSPSILRHVDTQGQSIFDFYGMLFL